MSERSELHGETVPLDWYCDRGPCGAQRGHDGTCLEASGWLMTCDDPGSAGQSNGGRWGEVDE